MMFFRKKKEKESGISSYSKINDMIQKSEISDQEKTINEKKEEVTPIYLVSELGKCRYWMEHISIRDAFFQDPETTVKNLLLDGALFAFYNMNLTRVGFPNHYKPEQFKAGYGLQDPEVTHVLLELPEPEYTPLCYRIHLIYDSSHTKMSMYTVERGMQEGFLCAWDKNGVHSNIEQLKDPARNELDYKGINRAMEIFLVLDLFTKKYGIETKDFKKP